LNANPNDDLTDGLNTWALTRLDALRREAEWLIELFWGWADRQRKARPHSEWGRFGVRVRAQQNARSLPGAFGIEWVETYWVQGQQGRRAIHTRYLRRGKGLRYPRSTLSRVAKPRELAMADEFEEHFALIRGLLHSIAHVRKVLRKYQAVERSTLKAKDALYASAYDRQQSAEITDDRWG
jgi:hypothetical protein